MRKSVALLKQTFDINCEPDESSLIDEAVGLLNRRMTELNQQVNHREKALLMATLSLLVEQLKSKQQSAQQQQTSNNDLQNYQAGINSLNVRLNSFLS